jgi:hypothetical protein
MRQRIIYDLSRRVAPALAGIAALGSALQQTTSPSASGGAVTRMEYWEHDPSDFDFYISKPTIKDLPILLHKFDKEGLEVWPWIWCHPNNDGPHHVFVGISKDSLDEIQRLRDESSQNNILVIAPEEQLREVALTRNDPDIYERCLCGLVIDSKVELLNHDAKILMLNDQRVIAFDRLILV